MSNYLIGLLMGFCFGIGCCTLIVSTNRNDIIKNGYFIKNEKIYKVVLEKNLQKDKEKIIDLIKKEKDE